MSRPFLILFTVLAATSAPAVAQATVRVEAANLQGSRSLQEQTATAAIRDYFQSWQVMSSALEQNRADLLDPDFVGSAKDTLTETIQQQTALGISTRYQDRAHDLQIVSYSPDGLSIELIDKVDYDMQVLDHDQVKTTQHVSDRYVIVLTPAEVRWRVRVFQGASR
jgi:predicted PhzF superfamily epimerase YddE/YHI9